MSKIRVICNTGKRNVRGFVVGFTENNGVNSAIFISNETGEFMAVSLESLTIDYEK